MFASRRLLAMFLLISGFASRAAFPAPGDLLFTLYDSTPAAYDLFGFGLATVNNFIIASTRTDATQARNGGALSVFEGFTGQRIATIYNPTTDVAHGADGQFGSAVAARAVSGRLLALASAPYELQGRVYAVSGSQTSRTVTTLINPRNNRNDSFGQRAVEVVGDLFAVEGYSARDAGTYTGGVVYLFNSTGGLLRELRNPRPTSPSSSEFGSRLKAVGKNLLVSPFRLGMATEEPTYVYLYNTDPASAGFGELLHEFVLPPTNRPEYNFYPAMAALGNNVVIGSQAEDSAKGVVRLYDGDPASPTFGSVLLTIREPVEVSFGGFGHAVAVTGNQIIIAGGYYLYTFDGSLRGETNTALLRITPPPTAGQLFAYELGALENGNIVAADSTNDEYGIGSGAVYVFQGGVGGDVVESERVFNIEDGLSDFMLSVEAEPGATMTFRPNVSGTIRATVYESGGKVAGLRVHEVDVRADDIHTSNPFRIDVTGARAVLDTQRGVVGAPAPIQDGGFNLQGNEFQFDGEAEAEIADETFSISGGPTAGSLPTDVFGLLSEIPVGGGTIHAGPSKRLELALPLNLTRVVAWQDGPFEPTIRATGTVMAREVPALPLNPVLPFLLGVTSDPALLDLNLDLAVDIADALTFLIQGPP